MTVTGANPVSVTMDGAKSVTATFTQDEYALTVNVVGSGSVAKVPIRLVCFWYCCYFDCYSCCLVGRFAGWSGDVAGSTNPVSVTMDGAKSVTATFTQDQYTLTVTVVGSGSVAKVPDQATYHSGDCCFFDCYSCCWLDVCWLEW